MINGIPHLKKSKERKKGSGYILLAESPHLRRGEATAGNWATSSAKKANIGESQHRGEVHLHSEYRQTSEWTH